jgi:hypothetical protein
MKTLALLTIFASGLIWPTLVHETQHGGKTVIYKTPGPVVPISKPRVVQWCI